MPLTHSIATGIGLGFITYAASEILSGQYKEATPGHHPGAAVRREIRCAVSEGRQKSKS